MLRSCNITKAFVYAEDGTPIPVRWYITDPDAPPLGFESAFCHPIWEEHWHNEFEGPGILLRGAEWASNKLDTPRTYQVLGKLDWWQNGLPADFDPGDTACGSLLLGATGGVLIGGSGFAGGPTEAARTCGCGQASSAVWVSVITSQACGCGQPSSLQGSHVITSTVCGCGSAMVGCFEFDCLSVVCGCGQPSSYQPGGAPILAEVCGCGGSTSTVHAGIAVACCPVPVPTSLVLTITNVSNCQCLAGMYTLNWNPAQQAWVSTSQALCGQSASYFTVYCATGPVGFRFTRGVLTPSLLSTVSCDPVDLRGTGISGGPFCAGTFNVEVTQ